jgi:hypothetical protein
MFDVFFISYGESNQEENWQRLLEFHPEAKRLHGIDGIDRVHLACDSLSTSDWFWTVDGDNYLLHRLAWWVDNADVELFMFNALDPIVNQPTTLGGVKLWKKGNIVNTDMSKGDFCLNATPSKWVHKDVFSISRFNATPYEAWKTAFRHCVKLQSRILENRYKADSMERYLNNWENCKNLDNGVNNANWAYQGFLDAKDFVLSENPLTTINEYRQLKKYFKDKHGDI